MTEENKSGERMGEETEEERKQGSWGLGTKGEKSRGDDNSSVLHLFADKKKQGWGKKKEVRAEWEKNTWVMKKGERDAERRWHARWQMQAGRKEADRKRKMDRRERETDRKNVD